MSQKNNCHTDINKYLTHCADSLPLFLLERRQFVLRRGKQPFGWVPESKMWTPRDWNDPRKWVSFHEAMEALRAGKLYGADGIGWVCRRALDGDFQIVFIDLDSVRDPQTGWVHPEADRFLRALKSPFVEVSMSGCGFHAVVQCKRPPFEKNIERFDLSGDLPDEVRQHIFDVKHAEKVDLKPETIKPAIEVFQSGKHVALTFHLAKEYCDGAGRDDYSDILAELLRPCLKAATKRRDIIDLRKARRFLDEAIDRAEPGTRNDTGLWLACQLRDLGLSFEDAAEWMLEYQQEVEHLDGAESYTQREALNTLESAYSREPREPPIRRRASAATWLFQLARENFELWYDQSETSYACVKLPNGGEANYPVRSSFIKSTLSNLFIDAFGKTPPKQALLDCIDALDAYARRGPCDDAQVRISKQAGKIYVDLGRSDWRILEISAEGWQIIEKAPIRFVRFGQIGELPIPQEGGSWEELRQRLRAKMDDDDFVLVVAWMLQAVWPDGPYTHLIVDGEQGSGKTVLCKILKLITDPSDTLLRRPPRNEEELYVAARGERIVAIDNLSGIPDTLSDAFCCLSTGASFAKRRLYTDFEETKVSLRRPCLLNGIEAMPYRPDLLDRIIRIRLNSLDESEMITEEEIIESVREYMPKIWGLLVKAASAGLRNKERTREILRGKLPRMADFAVWVAACEEALPWAEGTILNAYKKNRKGCLLELAESDRFVMAIYQLAQEHMLKGKAWRGFATELFNILCRIAEIDPARPPRDWPQNPRALGRRLMRSAPTLRTLRIDVKKIHSKYGTEYEISLSEPVDEKKTNGESAGDIRGDKSDISILKMSPKNPHAQGSGDNSDKSDISIQLKSCDKEKVVIRTVEKEQDKTGNKMSLLSLSSPGTDAHRFCGDILVTLGDISERNVTSETVKNDPGRIKPAQTTAAKKRQQRTDTTLPSASTSTPPARSS